MATVDKTKSKTKQPKSVFEPVSKLTFDMTIDCLPLLDKIDEVQLRSALLGIGECIKDNDGNDSFVVIIDREPVTVYTDNVRECVLAISRFTGKTILDTVLMIIGNYRLIDIVRVIYDYIKN